MAQRGSYAKGVAKRQEILHAALDVVAREGYRGASVKQIADAAGLSQAGLLHYFGSKEELFTEILRTRDEVDTRAFWEALGDAPSFSDVASSYLRLIRHNADVPGLVHLFSRLSVDAADPQHPAFEYFVARSAHGRASIEAAVAAGQRAGTITAAIPPATAARMLQALADGMQLQWMLEPDEVDMAEAVGALFTLLTTARKDPDDTAS